MNLFTVHDPSVPSPDLAQNHQITNQHHEEWTTEAARDHENGVGWCFGPITKADGLDRGIAVIGPAENRGKRKYKGKRGGH